jgi:hypothetical protein
LAQQLHSIVEYGKAASNQPRAIVSGSSFNSREPQKPSARLDSLGKIPLRSNSERSLRLLTLGLISGVYLLSGIHNFSFIFSGNKARQHFSPAPNRFKAANSYFGPWPGLVQSRLIWI